WWQQHGSVIPNLQLHRGQFGYGFVTNASIDMNEDFASIPLSMVLSHRIAEDSEIGSAIRQINSETRQRKNDNREMITRRSILYLFMIFQLHDSDSFFYPYLKSLPSN